jgi:hypothetical protein
MVTQTSGAYFKQDLSGLVIILLRFSKLNNA